MYVRKQYIYLTFYCDDDIIFIIVVDVVIIFV